MSLSRIIFLFCKVKEVELKQLRYRYVRLLGGNSKSWILKSQGVDEQESMFLRFTQRFAQAAAKGAFQKSLRGNLQGRVRNDSIPPHRILVELLEERIQANLVTAQINQQVSNAGLRKLLQVFGPKRRSRLPTRTT